MMMFELVGGVKKIKGKKKEEEEGGENKNFREKKKRGERDKKK